jgi:hypothetical protein
MHGAVYVAAGLTSSASQPRGDRLMLCRCLTSRWVSPERRRPQERIHGRGTLDGARRLGQPRPTPETLADEDGARCGCSSGMRGARCVKENVTSVFWQIRGRLPAARIDLMRELKPRRLVELIHLVLRLRPRIRGGDRVELASVHLTHLLQWACPHGSGCTPLRVSGGHQSTTTAVRS